MEYTVLGPDRNFLALEPEHSSLERSRIVVVPAPYEYRTSFGKGTKQGPEAILAASAHVETYDEEFDRELCYEVGLATLEPIFLDGLQDEAAIQAVESVVQSLLQQGKFVVTLGGEHTIALAPIRAHFQAFPQMSLLQLDAHADLRPIYDGSPYSHACVMARVLEFFPQERLVQVGVRALSREEMEFINQAKSCTFFAEAVRGSYFGERWYNMVLEKLGPEVYITLDVDVLDPSQMPATGTPEPNGLWYQEVIRLLRRIQRGGHRIIGFDIVEFAPIPGFHFPDITLARLVYKILNIALET
ncbi:MAG: agmatinase [Candidatus Kapabacteria bacterium]|nr:agmatinase [Candidatus Kapabacteria bacterium]MDW7996839.1 agmatinase [Bacteroidota bacterium]MDW8224898.1 agmatinase [Bacteroidota bacterium]